MLKVLLFIAVAMAAVDYDSEVSDGDALISNIRYAKTSEQCIGSDTVVALNKQFVLNGKKYSPGTEVFFDDKGKGYIFTKSGAPISLNVRAKDFKCNDVTIIPINPETGELEEYNIPLDYQLAGKGKKAKPRKGTTYCYRAVKAIVNGNKVYARGRLKLSGVAAKSAYPQLESSGMKKYSDYKSAPKGAICVFGAGGKATSSGGHKYGHIGIKGRGGVINPQVGFTLKRPFLACYK